ncbi:MAG: outer membrane protein assembly factor BamE [Nitrosomonas sp.]|nr:outer membrane protein assembly factor BamE [Nitrosomonas sp.]
MTIKIITLLVFWHLLAGCSLAPRILYKIDVQQGNVVTDEMLEKLRPGMTRPQVRFVLGSPLIVDPFRNSRWDYAYIQRIRGELVEQKRLTIYFEDDRLIRTELQEIYSGGKKSRTDLQSRSENPEDKELGSHSEHSATTDAESGNPNSAPDSHFDKYQPYTP